MSVKQEDIEIIIKQVLSNIKNAKKISTNTSIGSSVGIFEDMNDAIEAATVAQKKIKVMTIQQRESIIVKIREKTIENARILAELGVEETGMGRVDHKILKHELLANKTPGTEDIKTIAWSGDKGLTLVEMGPFGVIGSITPSTNPSETILCNSIGMIAAGNTVVFNPHPGAIKVSLMAVKIVNEASMEAGGPANIVTTVFSPTLESCNILMKHKNIALIAATGGPGVVTAALSSGKRAIGAGAGNPPVVVDETADLPKAARDIIDGASFDNNLPCIAEKEVVAVKEITDELMYYMVQNGAYEITPEEAVMLTRLVFTDNKGKLSLNRDWIGKDAYKILRALGKEVNENIRCIIFKGPKDHPLIIEELMMPILGIVEVEDFDEAVQVAKLLEQGNRHSAHMHSRNIQNLTRLSREIDTAIFVKNAPSYAALGFGGEGYCTFTIASRTGEGLTSTKTFTKSRRCVLADGLSIR
ncbi:aldehyde dehydrogenase EutE [Clostridium estertheticum]|uniref:aldehyde dehydrogenase family protein n=1 Tax=Clostridium estertheticum TaxID=238834 RepID=UPI0013E98CB5|nr:aldehyde dehydrogenase family protein [Clostridium estertheticum]MBZ9686049.1 aldehyde dehydrogenase EutE [Clostridium estertheticum]